MAGSGPLRVQRVVVVVPHRAETFTFLAFATERIYEFRRGEPCSDVTSAHWSRFPTITDIVPERVTAIMADDSG
jgi:hypothetical protein